MVKISRHRVPRGLKGLEAEKWSAENGYRASYVGHLSLTAQMLYEELTRLNARIDNLQRNSASIRLELQALYEQRSNFMGAFSKARKSTGSDRTGINLLLAYDSGKLHAAIAAVASEGHVIQIGVTRKGNALMISVYDGKENEKQYPETMEELDEVIDTLLDYYGADYQATPPPPKKSKTRGRSANSGVGGGEGDEDSPL